MKKTRTVFFYILIIALLALLGFYRDFVFKNINAFLQALDYEMQYDLPPSLNFMERYEYETLVRLKWILTLLFSLIYLLISFISVRFIFGDKKFSRITVGAYLGIILISGIFILLGMVFGNSGKMYEFARYLMGMAQSPLILMILIPIFKLAEKKNLG